MVVQYVKTSSLPSACTHVTVPSTPSISDAPGGGGYEPFACRRSNLFTPAAQTYNGCGEVAV